MSVISLTEEKESLLIACSLNFLALLINICIAISVESEKAIFPNKYIDKRMLHLITPLDSQIFLYKLF